jgi:hypothetical protein
MQGTMAGVVQVEGRRMETNNKGVVDDGPGGLRLRPVSFHSLPFQWKTVGGKAWQILEKRILQDQGL